MADDLNRDARDAGKGPKTNDIIHHDNHPDVGDHVGEAAGGISGVLAGAAIGSAGGPIGTIIGGIAGAIGGWWSGRAISEAATKFTHSDDDHYRKHYETSSTRLADRTYDDVRPAYQLGHVASHNPDYANRDFDAVERDLQAGWSDDLRAKHGEWTQVRGYARDAYARGRATVGHDTTVDRKTGAPTTADQGTSSASGLSSGAAAGSGLGAAGLGDRIASKVDDLKDRVDGNPASRPGPDATDSDRRF